MRRRSPIVLPSQDDPVVASILGWLGGPVGRLARIGSTWWTPVRVLVAIAAAAYVVGYLLDLSCRGNGWAVPDRYEHLCYTDIAPLYSLRGFAEGIVPYLQPAADGQHLEYPVLTGAFMQAAAMLTSAVTAVIPTVDRVVAFFDVNVVLLFVALAVTVIATALTVRRRPWDAAMVALAPTMILGATINWDLLPLAFAGVALLLWSRKHPFAAGILLGLAVAAKFYPVLFLGGFLVLSLRTARWRELGLLVGGTALAWAVVNVPVALASFDGWAQFYRFSSTRGEDFGSVWYAMTQAGLPGIPAERLNLVATGGFLVLCAGIAWVALSAPRRPRLAAVLFLIVAAFLITNKVYSPQYSLWLVPLAVMARPRWRDFLVWQTGEVVYFAAIWWFLAGYGIDDTTGLTGQQYATAVIVHVVATGYFAIMVIRDIYAPEHDPIRRDGLADDSDDPGGGAYDGAPDRFTLGRGPRRSTTW
ncbi:MAG: glycosyltransferase family 87 protein [Candidatus Nanopelagicales bacterium]